MPHINSQLRTWKVLKITTYQTKRRLTWKAKISAFLSWKNNHNKKIGSWRKYVEFDIRMIVGTQAISPHSYVKLLWESILMRGHESQWKATLKWAAYANEAASGWTDSACAGWVQKLNVRILDKQSRERIVSRAGAEWVRCIIMAAEESSKFLFIMPPPRRAPEALCFRVVRPSVRESR